MTQDTSFERILTNKRGETFKSSSHKNPYWWKEIDPSTIISIKIIVTTLKIILTQKCRLKSLYIEDTLGSLFENTRSSHLDLKGWWRDKLISSSVNVPWGVSSLAHKSYAWAIIEKCSRIDDDSDITFKEEEVEYLNPNYDDALVVFMRMLNAQMKRVMINISNFANILYFDVF